MSRIVEKVRTDIVDNSKGGTYGTKSVVKETEDRLDPAEVLTDLKHRELLLNQLIKKGHNSKDINELKSRLQNTMKELEELLASTEIDSLSGEAI